GRNEPPGVPSPCAAHSGRRPTSSPLATATTCCPSDSSPFRDLATTVPCSARQRRLATFLGRVFLPWPILPAAPDSADGVGSLERHGDTGTGGSTSGAGSAEPGTPGVGTATAGRRRRPLSRLRRVRAGPDPDRQAPRIPGLGRLRRCRVRAGTGPHLLAVAHRTPHAVTAAVSLDGGGRHRDRGHAHPFGDTPRTAGGVGRRLDRRRKPVERAARGLGHRTVGEHLTGYGNALSGHRRSR